MSKKNQKTSYLLWFNSFLLVFLALCAAISIFFSSRWTQLKTLSLANSAHTSQEFLLETAQQGDFSGLPLLERWYSQNASPQQTLLVQDMILLRPKVLKLQELWEPLMAEFPTAQPVLRSNAILEWSLLNQEKAKSIWQNARQLEPRETQQYSTTFKTLE